MERKIREGQFGGADLILVFEDGAEVYRYPQEDGSFELYFYDGITGYQWTMRGFDNDRNSRDALNAIMNEGPEGLTNKREMESIADLYGGSFSVIED